MSEKNQYQKVVGITEKLEQGIKELFESDRYREFLNTMSRFPSYSLNNNLLICSQRPDATLVASYTTWQKEFGRQVKRGEKAIRILAPAPYVQTVEMDRIDPVTQKAVTGSDGKPEKITKEIKRLTFKLVSCFDISQTEGKELPSIGVDELTGTVQEYENIWKALTSCCPVPVGFEAIEGSAKGDYHQTDRRIAIREGMSQVQNIKTLIHEMVHEKLHAVHPDQKETDAADKSRNEKEVEAESAAYTICQHYGIETSEYSFAYIAGWSQGKEISELKSSLQVIRQTANEMITAIDEKLAEMKQEIKPSIIAAIKRNSETVEKLSKSSSMRELHEGVCL